MHLKGEEVVESSSDEEDEVEVAKKPVAKAKGKRR